MDDFIVWANRKYKNIIIHHTQKIRHREFFHKYLCIGNKEPFCGFTKELFDIIRESDMHYDALKDMEYNNKIFNTLYFNFRCFGYEIRSSLAACLP